MGSRYAVNAIPRLNIIDVAKNQLLAIPGIMTMAKRFHTTGIMDDPKKVEERFRSIVEFVGRNLQARSIEVVCELGPGQTIGLLRRLRNMSGVRGACAVDIIDYFGEERWSKEGIMYCNFDDMSKLPENSVDLIVSYDTLEHVREPRKLLDQCHRILRNGGLAFFSWDLRDHLNLREERRWFEMHKYGSVAWELQMSRRSSYVNRLLRKDWEMLFRQAELTLIDAQAQTSQLAAAELALKYGIIVDPTYRMQVWLRN
jgi:SAM-dependent methyltransferase